MAIRFTIPNSGITIEGDNLTEVYQHVGGSGEFLSAHLKRAITAFEHGPAVATAQASLGGEVIETSDPDADHQQVDDPWDSHPSSRQTRNAPPRGAPKPSAPQHRGDPSAYLGEDRFGNKFYTDPAAPECDCGVKAIRGAFTSQAGKRYGAFVCADAGPKEAGADYRNKCGFRQFINGKRN